MATEGIKQTEFMERVDNLMTAIEMYRDVEKKAVSRIKELLHEKGIELSTEEIRGTDKESMKERLLAAKNVRKTKEKRLEEKRTAEEAYYKAKVAENRKEEYVCRR